MLGHPRKLKTMKRNLNIDQLKGIAIFGVVWIHSAHLFIQGDLPVASAIRDIFRFSVPAFIIVWAFFFEKGLQKSENNHFVYMGRKFLHLFGVFMIWSLIYFCIVPDSYDLSFKSLITKYWSGYGWSGQYFFIILFQLLIIFPLLRYIYSHAFLRSIVIIACLAIYLWLGYWGTHVPEFIWKAGDRLFIYWIPYVFLAIYLVRKPVEKVSFYWCLALLLIPLEFYLLAKANLPHTPYVTPAVFLASAAVTICFLAKRVHLPQLPLSCFSQLGMNSMTIFVANPIVILILHEFINPVTLPPESSLRIPAQILLPLLSTIICVMGCLLISWIIKKTHLDGKLN